MGRPRKKPAVIYIERPSKVALLNDVITAYKRTKHLEGKLSGPLERTVGMWQCQLGAMQCHDITQQIVEDALIGVSPRAKPNTIAYRINVLKAILNHGLATGLITEVPKLKPPRYFDARDEHLDMAEVNQVLTWLWHHGDNSALAIATLIYTGVRVNELCLLEGRHFGIDELTVNSKRGKTRATRTIPYAESYAKTFRPSSLMKIGGRVFVGLAHTPAAMSEFLGRELKAALKACGITRNVRVHDLRHTFAYLCGAAGVDLGDLQMLMGHSNISMTMRYRGFIKSRAVDVMKKI